LWADCHSDQATISTPPNALIRRSFERLKLALSELGMEEELFIKFA
jgi:hypothetical protein